MVEERKMRIWTFLTFFWYQLRCCNIDLLLETTQYNITNKVQMDVPSKLTESIAINIFRGISLDQPQKTKIQYAIKNRAEYGTKIFLPATSTMLSYNLSSKLMVKALFLVSTVKK